MAIGKPIPDLSQKFNSNYNVTLDMSGWTETTIQVIAPVSGAILVYGSNDSGAQQQNTQGNASLAINFQNVQVTNLATGASTGSINAAGLYKYPVDAQFLRLQGSPVGAGTNVYRLLLFHSKID